MSSHNSNGCRSRYRPIQYRKDLSSSDLIKAKVKIFFWRTIDQLLHWPNNIGYWFSDYYHLSIFKKLGLFAITFIVGFVAVVPFAIFIPSAPQVAGTIVAYLWIGQITLSTGCLVLFLYRFCK